MSQEADTALKCELMCSDDERYKDKCKGFEFT